ncbi:MAG: hypothetical protein ABI275_10510 [Terrimesophilobacter sp.]
MLRGPPILGAGAFGFAGAAGVLGAIGVALGDPWVIAVAVAAITGLVAWILRHRPARPTPTADDCCFPKKSASSRATIDHTDAHQR